MNLSTLQIEDTELSLEKPDTSSIENRVGELTALIEASARIRATDEWSTLKGITEDRVEQLVLLQKQEASKTELNLPELYRLQGRIIEAKKHSLSALEAMWRQELLQLRRQITPATSRG